MNLHGYYYKSFFSQYTDRVKLHNGGLDYSGLSALRFGYNESRVIGIAKLYTRIGWKVWRFSRDIRGFLSVLGSGGNFCIPNPFFIPQFCAIKFQYA